MIEVKELNCRPSRLIALPSEEIVRVPKRGSCPACISKSVEAVVSLGGDTIDDALTLVVCAICGHACYDRNFDDSFMDKYYKSTWDELGRQQTLSQYERKKIGEHQRLIYESLLLPKESRILDYGCGLGNILAMLRENGFQFLAGFELSTHRVEFVRNHLQIDVVTHDFGMLKEFASRNGGFDFITSSHVLEHVARPDDLLRELKGLLRNDGRILIRVPAWHSESEVQQAMFLPHLHVFSEASLKAIFERIGMHTTFYADSRDEVACLATLTKHSPKPGWKVEADRPSADEYRKFVSAPWTSLGSGSQCLNYWHPQGFRRGEEFKTGFQVFPSFVYPLLKGRTDTLWARIIRKAMRLTGVGGAVGHRFLEVSKRGSDNEIWLRLPDSSAIPVLMK